MEAALPDSFYYVIGVLVVMSAGSLISAVGLIIKASLWMGAFQERMKRLEADNNAAHTKIREIERKGK